MFAVNFFIGSFILLTSKTPNSCQESNDDAIESVRNLFNEYQRELSEKADYFRSFFGNSSDSNQHNSIYNDLSFTVRSTLNNNDLPMLPSSSPPVSPPRGLSDFSLIEFGDYSPPAYSSHVLNENLSNNLAEASAESPSLFYRICSDFSS